MVSVASLVCNSSFNCALIAVTDIETLVLQKEEVESVRWFDLEETYQNCRNRNTQFCAPVPGLEVVRRYLYS